MAANPNQPSQDLTTRSPHVPTMAEVEHRLAQLQSLLPQRNPNPPPTPKQPEPPRAASPKPPTHLPLDKAALHGLSRNQISRLFYGHVDSGRIDAALEQLAAFGALAAYIEQTGGRRSTLWLPVQQQQAAEALTENE